MSFVSSVCVIGVDRNDEQNILKFFREFHDAATLFGYPDPAEVSNHSTGRKGVEMMVFLVGYNYLNVDLFKSMFEAFPWAERPTVIARFGESDYITIIRGSSVYT